MGLFDRKASTDHVDQSQRASDSKVLATEFIARVLSDYTLNPDGAIHLWYAGETEQVQLCQAALAYCGDRIAETLISLAQDTWRGRRLPQDVELFARRLSDNARLRLHEIEAVDPDSGTWEFNDDTRNALYPDNQLPWWPVDAPGADLPQEVWQRREVGVVSDDLIRGVVGAALQFYTQTVMDKDSFTKRVIAETPEELAATFNIIDSILGQAFNKLSQAQTMMEAERVAPGIRGQAYRLAHDGLIQVMTANMALVAPPMLGPDFRNQWDEE